MILFLIKFWSYEFHAFFEVLVSTYLFLLISNEFAISWLNVCHFIRGKSINFGNYTQYINCFIDNNTRIVPQWWRCQKSNKLHCLTAHWEHALLVGKENNIFSTDKTKQLKLPKWDLLLIRVHVSKNTHLLIKTRRLFWQKNHLIYD